MATQTVFFLNASHTDDSDLFVTKQPLKPTDADPTFTDSNNSCHITWNQLSKERVHKDEKLRLQFTRWLYYQEWDRFLNDLKSFLIWSFDQWAQPDNPLMLQGKALDALLTNTCISPEGNYKSFDLEWSLHEPMQKSWFILRNICTFIFTGSHYLFSKKFPCQSLRDIYVELCKTLSIPASFDEDIDREANLQTLITLTPKENHRSALLQGLLSPFENTLPKSTTKERQKQLHTRQVYTNYHSLQAIHQNLIQEYQHQNKVHQDLSKAHQDLMNTYQETDRVNHELQITVQSLHQIASERQIILDSLPHRMAGYLSRKFSRIHFINHVLKTTILFLLKLFGKKQ